MKSYRLSKYINGIPHFAIISASLALRENTASSVALSIDAFAWIQQAYQEEAILPKLDNEFITAASAGAKLALRELKITNKRIVFEKIQFLLVDTSVGDMAFASYQLVYQLVTGTPKFETVSANALEEIKNLL